MVYLTSWDDFVERSVQLFRANPEKTRYAMKYRHSEGKLILKVTDDKEDIRIEKEVVIKNPRHICKGSYCWNSGICLKFKTDQAQDAKKMEKLNNIFFTLMARGPETDITEVTGKEQTESHPSRKGRGRKQ